jgi:DUF4097 and DUF4098 domain-containing protein YvlB
MGKRELVLISVFVVLGFCVYQFTAPPPLPGSEGVSIGGIFRNMQRTIHGARESAVADSTQNAPIDAAIKELRLNIPRMSDVTVTGEDRSDLSAEVHVTARGYDQAEAKAGAEAVKLKIDRVGDALVVILDTSATLKLPRNNSQGQIVIVLKVPSRLGLRAEPHSGRLVATHLASAEIMASRGETRMSAIPGRLVLTHSGGALELEDLGSLKLNARNSRGSVKKVSGALAVDSIGSDLAMNGIIGPLEIEARNTDLKIDDIKGLKAPLRINSTSGEIIVRGLRSEARLDGRNSVVEVTLDAPAPVTIYNLGDIRVTAPPGGYTLDAVATEGHITMDDGDLKPSEGPDPHVTGPVRGGGPTLTLRSTRGSITVRKPAGK